MMALIWYVIFLFVSGTSAVAHAREDVVPHPKEEHDEGLSHGHTFAVGQRVWVARGPFSGVVGVIISIEKRLFHHEPWAEIRLEELDDHGHHYWMLVPACTLEPCEE